MTDVIVTVIGGHDTAMATRRGGGRLGLRSSANAPFGAVISFVDWPFQLDNPQVQDHIDVVKEHRPTYAVAPDVDGDRDLEAVLDIAWELNHYAETVIVVPKTVSPAVIPNRYLVGLPFRKGLDTPVWKRRSLPEFTDRPVHILGGNPNHALSLRDEYGLEVVSADTPLILEWAEWWRVFIGAGGGGVEVSDLPATPMETNLRTRAGRVEFSVSNLVQAWNDRRIEITTASVHGVQTRGMPPILPPADTIGWEERREAEQLYGKPYEEIRRERAEFEDRMRESTTVATYRQSERQIDLARLA